MRRQTVIVGAVGVVCLGLIAWLASGGVQSHDGRPVATAERLASPADSADGGHNAPAADKLLASVGIPIPTGEWQPKLVVPEVIPTTGALPWHLDKDDYEDGDYDPNKRPFAEWQYDLFQGIPEGWTVDGLAEKNGGVVLGPQASRDAAGIRRGRLETGPIKASIPFNAFVPMWKSVVPPGTKVDVAVSVSANGRDWGAWNQAVPDAEAQGEMEQRMPDGRMNPNAGYDLAAPMYGDRRLYSHVRFRVTFYSANDSSPLLDGFRMNLFDVTHGRGQMAAIVPAEEFYPDVSAVY